MPKIKPTTLFCKRTLSILLVDDSSQNSLVKAAMLAQPIADELMKQAPKVKPEILHVEDAKDTTINALRTIDALTEVTQPTIIVAPRMEPSNGDKSTLPLVNYIKFLVASGGGFIVRVVNDGEYRNDINAALPILRFNGNTHSYMDIEYKVQTIIKRILSPDNISHHMTVQSVANNPWLHNKLGLCLGSWNRALADEVDGKELSLIVNVKGIPGSPITPEEFVSKVWCKDESLQPLLNPATALVVRNPSIESKLVLAKVLSDKNNVKNIKFIEA